MTLPRYALLLASSTLIAVGGSALLVARGFAELRRGGDWPGTGPFWIVALAGFLLMALTDLRLRLLRTGVIVLKPRPGRPPASKLLFLGFMAHVALSAALVLTATATAPLGRIPGGWWVSLLIPTGAVGGLWLTVWTRTKYFERRLLRS